MTHSNRTLRPARESDVPRLVEIARRAWLSAFAQTAPIPLIVHWAAADRESTWYARDWRDMIVLDEDGVAIGLVQPKFDEVNGLWVHPDHQGTGAGITLLAAGEEVVRHAGHATAWLNCSAFNHHALRFYLRRGYIEVSRATQTHPCGIEVEDVRMERSLTNPARRGTPTRVPPTD